MEEYGKKEAGIQKDSTGGQAEAPSLPNHFFAQLLNLPACKAKGRCNDCGRCER